MKTADNKTNDFKAIMMKAISDAEKTIKICNEEIECLTHPEKYGCCLCNCNSIVINKERMMTVTTDDTHHTTFEFSPDYPTYFSPETARRIVEKDIYRDCFNNIIKLEIIGRLEYYRLLKEHTESGLSSLKSAFENIK